MQGADCRGVGRKRSVYDPVQGRGKISDKISGMVPSCLAECSLCGTPTRKVCGMQGVLVNKKTSVFFSITYFIQMEPTQVPQGG